MFIMFNYKKKLIRCLSLFRFIINSSLQFKREAERDTVRGKERQRNFTMKAKTTKET